MPLKILLNGCAGRMGQAIAAVAQDSDCEIFASCDAGDDPSAAIADCDVVVEFSMHKVTPAIVKLAAEHGKPVVIGTTGHSSEEREAILAHTKTIPIVWAGNYSIGVNVLFWLTRKAAEILGPDYNPEIIEMHHRHKLDAPSGTAERLIEVVRDGRKIGQERISHGREGIVGVRQKNEIGVHALRGGSVVGEHEVIFAGEGERVSLSHSAGDRKIFALGALRAAHWSKGKTPGLYRMEDVLGLV
ncbi:4-hydroxy-tetrahydrodipicolinate reductase [Rubellicoccus peritrichatus]|uniref:4-hydroxy-tetrahydrodipicolinate reductase n=1 Tax=Rubellicoccus peritrichatus TaxID=3080537 RepID=A0AAQ3LFD2_9BACT|nr:4-hydroxy-tetrahydrodipicolinate reductase [Puniceicoccus sp. CR14]WOO43524.1 4-hydroxy-tetrahydrodipicolinate reductase [Puniceicoccus sp. CR14]